MQGRACPARDSLIWTGSPAIKRASRIVFPAAGTKRELIQLDGLDYPCQHQPQNEHGHSISQSAAVLARRRYAGRRDANAQASPLESGLAATNSGPTSCVQRQPTQAGNGLDLALRQSIIKSAILLR